MYKEKYPGGYITRVIIVMVLWSTLSTFVYKDARAEVLVIPSADSYIYIQQGDTNFDDDGLYIGYNNFPGFVSQYETYLKYDLRDVMSETGRSTFNFYITENGWPANSIVSLSLYSVSIDSWDETTLTWNNSPAVTNPGSITLLETKLLAAGTTGLVTFGSTTNDNPVGAYIESQRVGDKDASFLLRITSVSNGGFAGIAVAEDRESTRTPDLGDEPYLDMRSPTALTLTDFTVSNSPSSRVALWLGIGISLLMLGGVFLLRKRSRI